MCASSRDTAHEVSYNPRPMVSRGVRSGDTWQIVAPLAGDKSMRGLAALKRLRPEQREKLQRRLHARAYRRGEVIYHADEEARSLYVVLAGVVRLSIPWPNGRRVLLNLLPAGEAAGALDCLRDLSGSDAGKSHLLVALCRNRDIPARLVSGRRPQRLSSAVAS